MKTSTPVWLKVAANMMLQYSARASAEEHTSSKNEAAAVAAATAAAAAAIGRGVV